MIHMLRCILCEFFIRMSMKVRPDGYVSSMMETTVKMVRDTRAN